MGLCLDLVFLRLCYKGFLTAASTERTWLCLNQLWPPDEETEAQEPPRGIQAKDKKLLFSHNIQTVRCPGNEERMMSS